MALEISQSKLQRKKIYIVDDDPDIRGILADLLVRAGADVEEDDNGDLAFEKINKTKYDLILTDLNMPGIDGLELIKKPKKSDVNAETPLIMVSGYLDEAKEKEIVSAGAVSVIQKPFRLQSLVDLITQKLYTTQFKGSFTQKNVGCVVAAIKDVLTFYLKDPPKIKAPNMKNGNQSYGDVSALIGFNSPSALGSIAVSLDMTLLSRIGKAMMGEDISGIRDDIDVQKDIAGEVCNQLLGKIRTNFGRLGVNISLGIPEVLSGESHFIVHKINSTILAVPITHGSGACQVEPRRRRAAAD